MSNNWHTWRGIGEEEGKGDGDDDQTYLNEGGDGEEGKDKGF